MELAIALTLYLSFGAFLFFGTMGAPPAFGRVAIGLCGYELVVTVAWVVSRHECPHTECTAEKVFGSVAGVDVPVLTAITLLLAAGYGLRAARRAQVVDSRGCGSSSPAPTAKWARQRSSS